MVVYGIKNCDTVKKALTWLKNKNIPYEFHDYKTKGISREKLEEWSGQMNWEFLLNKKGTTWKQLDDETKAAAADRSAAFEVMISKTSVIKRPLIEKEGKVIALGFNEEEYESKVH